MKQKEFVELIALDLEISKPVVRLLLKGATELIWNTLKVGGLLSVPRLGMFHVHKSKAQNRYNPMTGGTYFSPAHNVPSLRLYIYCQKVLQPNWKPYVTVQGLQSYKEPDAAKSLSITANYELESAGEFLNYIAVKIAEIVATGDKVSINNLGSFKKTFTPAHNGRNPRTGATIAIKARWHIRFTAAKKLWLELN